MRGRLHGWSPTGSGLTDRAKLRATRPPAQGCGTTVRARQGANTPFPLRRSPPASFKRLLGRCPEGSPGLARHRRWCPIAELLLEADTLKIGDASLEVGPGVGDRLIVHGRSNLLEEVVEQHAGLEVTDILFEVLCNVALDGGEKLFCGFLGEFDG